MGKSKRLLEIAEDNNIEIIDMEIQDDDFDGLYADNTILMNNLIKETRYNEVLAHELGHHFTLDKGNNLLRKQGKDMQEYFADAWSYRELIPIEKLVKYKLWDCEEWEILESEHITSDFLRKTFEYYRNKYGFNTILVDNFKIRFCPNFEVEKI